MKTRNNRRKSIMSFYCPAFALLLISIMLITGCGGGDGGTGGGTSGGGSGSGGSVGTSGAALTAIQLTPANPTMAIGSRLKLTITGTYSDNSSQDISGICQCTSSDPSVCSFDDNTETATALRQGTAVITSRDPSTGISGSTTITVSSVTLTSINVIPAGSTISVGASLQYMATGVFSDGSTSDLTAYVKFASSAADTASISEAGLAQALKAGSSTISASDSATGISGSTVLTVVSSGGGGGGGTGQGPVVTSISPTTLKAGDKCTITGSGFGTIDGKSIKANGMVYFGSFAATEYSSWSDTQIVCTVPNGIPAGTIIITVKAASGASSSASDTTQVTITSSGSGGGGGGGGGNPPSPVQTLAWRWENPLPTGNILYAIWGSAAGDIFAAGDCGTILHSNGTAWSSMNSNTQIMLKGIWGAASDNVYAVGDLGTILHYDGTAWSAVDTSSLSIAAITLNGISGTAADNIYAVGGSGTILHYDGTAWTAMDTGIQGLSAMSLTSVWACPCGTNCEVFVTGTSGTILHYYIPLGQQNYIWEQMTGTGTSDFYSIHGFSENNVYAVGAAGTILHYDGAVWSTPAGLPVIGLNLNSVSCIDTDNVFIVGNAGTFATALHYDGAAWKSMNTASVEPNILSGVWGSSKTDVYSVGDFGEIIHFDGNANENWTAPAVKYPTNALNNVWQVPGSSEVFGACDTGVIMHFDGTAWTATNECPGQEDLFGVWGLSASDVYAAGGGGYILHYYDSGDGRGLRWHVMSMGLSDQWEDIWGTSAQDIFAVGDKGTIAHYDGTSWTSMASGTAVDLESVWGSGPNDVYACGGDQFSGVTGVILHYDGTLWTTVYTGPNYLEAIHGSSADNVYASGYGGMILHFDGTSWQAMDAGTTTANFEGVWTIAPDNAYAVDEEGFMYHYDGTAWSCFLRMTSNELRAIEGNSATNILAVGEGGTVLHYSYK